jgi:hypothetical protein
MSEKSPTEYLTHFQLTRIRERALEDAIDFYFQDQDWGEVELAELACITHHSNGTEIFSIDDQDLVLFGASMSKIEVTGRSIQILHSMEIQELYK